MYKATITVTLRASILDPQGKAAQNALTNLGFEAIESVRVGKIVEMWINEESVDAARTSATAACEKLLANPVMEDFTVAVTEVPVEDQRRLSVASRS